MKPKHTILLFIDSIVNMVLGILLLLFPVGIIGALGLPSTDTHFYASILGAVLFGIGLALLLELFGYAKQVHGLGLGGAIIINIMGSAVFIGWLVFGALQIPLKGRILLWLIGCIVLVIGVVELVTKLWHYDE